MEGNQIVRFTRPYLPYNPGEVAGFDAEFAADLVKRQIAEYVVAKPAAEVKDKDEKKPR